MLPSDNNAYGLIVNVSKNSKAVLPVNVADLQSENFLVDIGTK